MKKILISMMALLAAVSLMIPAFAEDTPDTTQPVADTTTALNDAQELYRSNKETTDLAEYEEELKTMVANGTLTQEQADLLLTAAKEQQALANGTCPNCGYQFQTMTTGKKGHGTCVTGKGNRNSTTTTEDSTALEQAWAAYYAAKESIQMTEYEEELKTMVANGSLTQEQADLLLTAAKEQQALANGTCPNCGYQFQTTTTSNGKNGGKGHGGKH